MIFIVRGAFILLVLNLNGQNSGSNGFIRPEPQGWFTGDIHVHRSCNGSKPIPSSDLLQRMEENDLAVISVLSDMGNSDAPDRIEDLGKVDGKDSPLSAPGRIIHYSAEWHWDADEIQKPHQAIGGHLVFLGLDKAEKIWEESGYKVLEWAKLHKAICGYAHMQYLNDKLPEKLNCCIPIDYPIEVALGTIDFISEDCAGSDSAIEAYYKLLNCGFRIGLAAGTDYPCNGGEPFGSNLTYCNVPDGKLTYRKWIEAIRDGRTVISRNGHNEFLELRVNKSAQPGDVVNLKSKSNVEIEVKWTANKELSGNIEVVFNGKVVAIKKGSVASRTSLLLNTEKYIFTSGWICARRMDKMGHQVHTAPIFVSINNEPVRDNAEDAEFFVRWIDNIIINISPGGLWSKYYTHDLDQMINRYKLAEIFITG